MKEFFNLYPALAWSIVSLMLALVVIASLWERVKWWWINTVYTFPVVGKIASLSRDLNRDREDGWFKSERTLCHDYKNYIKLRDEHDFNQKITYITKAGDLGRRPTPIWLWLLTFVMVFVEAMGFSYVLAGWTIPGASEHLQQTGAYGIAFLISVILVAFTHFSGHELFKSGQIKHARREWAEDGRKHKFTSGPVALARPQEADDGHPAYTQLVNRVGTHPSHGITIATIVFVLVVAIFATYVRGQVLEQQLGRETVGADIGVGADPYATALPEADSALQTAALNKAHADDASIQRRGGWGTFIVLAFIFMFLQILGTVFGHRWGFGGKESADALRSLGGGRYSTYADVREHYKRIADTAQAKLEQLQQRLMDRNSEHGNEGMHTSRTFYEFIGEEHDRETTERESELQRVERRTKPVEPKPNLVESKPASASAPGTSLDDELNRLRTELESHKRAKENSEAKRMQDEETKRKQEEIAQIRAQLSEERSAGDTQ